MPQWKSINYPFSPIPSPPRQFFCLLKTRAWDTAFDPGLEESFERDEANAEGHRVAAELWSRLCSS